MENTVQDQTPVKAYWVLDQAADRLREDASATPGTLAHPSIALALASLLQQHSAWLAQADDDTPADAADLGDIGHVVEVARTVLRIGGAR